MAKVIRRWTSDAITTITGANSPYTIGTAVYTLLCNCTTAITVNLPAASTFSGWVFNIKKIDSLANAVTVVPNGADKIDGETSQTISSQWTNMQLQSNGTNWYIL